jgi:hypothetical protein
MVVRVIEAVALESGQARVDPVLNYHLRVEHILLS